MRVLDFQRIKGPLHEIKAVFHRVVALRQLQPATQAMVAERATDCQHVRVQISVPGAAAGNGKSKAHQITAIESANNLSADFLAHHEHAQGNQVNVSKIPNLFLQRDAGVEFVYALALADDDLTGFRHHHAHFSTSRLLACCHKDSISSSVASSSVRPCLRNCSSSQPNRRRNFLLVRRKADSESTER